MFESTENIVHLPDISVHLVEKTVEDKIQEYVRFCVGVSVQSAMSCKSLQPGFDMWRSPEARERRSIARSRP